MSAVLPPPPRPISGVRRTVGPARSRRFAELAAQHGDLLAVLAAVALGFLVRWRYIAVADFPLNDGGMFYVMTRELQRSHYLLPAFTSYNGAHIPFAYPPLGFYLAGLLSAGLHLSLLTVFRFLPLLVNLATIVAVYRLARTMLPSRPAAAIAAFAFALLPNSFVWTIMGGGLTRSLGLLFAVLAIQRFYLLYRYSNLRHLALAAIFSALTLLSHLEAAYFLGLTVLVLLSALGSSRRGLRDTVLVALGAAILATPWWATVVHQHGISPFTNSLHTGGNMALAIARLALLRFTGEALAPILGALALLGGLVAWRRRRFVVLWALAALVLDPRSGANYAVIPLALLVAIAVSGVLLPLLGAPDEPGPRAWRADQADPPAAYAFGGAAAGALAALLLFVVVSALMTAPKTLGALSRDDRQAMAWVAENTPPSSRFLVISGHGSPRGGQGAGEDSYSGWANDRVSEWFPALAGRVSVMTLQGQEWFGSTAQLEDEYAGAQDCALEGAACLASWKSKTDMQFGYVYIVKDEPTGQLTAEANSFDPADSAGCCESLRQSLLGDPGYALVYDGPAASIFAQGGGASPAAGRQKGKPWWQHIEEQSVSAAG